MDVVEGGSGPDRPGLGTMTDARWLRLIAIGVLVIAVCAGLTTWNVYRQAEMSRLTTCETVAFGSSVLMLPRAVLEPSDR